ncbi:MAG TPA: multicopper oxidase family protein [Methylovirgula sp.]
MRLNRRAFLSSTAALLLPAGARAAAPDAGDGYRVLSASRTDLAFLAPPEPKTAVTGFGARVPGPVLRYKKGEEVKIRLVNDLTQPVTFSSQGMRIVNAMDGVAGLTQRPVLPGQSFDYRFMPPDSGFYWYRSNVFALTDTQFDHGLYGCLIVDEPEPPPVDRDMVVVIDDWHLDAAAQILSNPDDPPHAGVKPSGHYIVTVNSEPAPLATEIAPGARVRLRLLSMIESQLVFITFTGLEPRIVAIDGQPCEPFAPLRHTIPIGPGACFDVMCDLPAEPGAVAGIAWRTGEPADRPLLTFATHGPRRPVLPAFSSLPANARLPARIDLRQSHKLDLVIQAAPVKGAAKDVPPALANDRHGRLSLNGAAAQGFAPKPLFSVKRGTPVTLGFINKTPILLQMHVHGHALRLLHDLDDGWEPYWRSYVIVSEGGAKHVAFVADNPGKWAIECRTVELRPSCLVSWFEVT